MHDRTGCTYRETLRSMTEMGMTERGTLKNPVKIN
jgi:hypothetical protein